MKGPATTPKKVREIITLFVRLKTGQWVKATGEERVLTRLLQTLMSDHFGATAWTVDKDSYPELDLEKISIPLN